MSGEGHILAARDVSFRYVPDRDVLRAVSISAGTGRLVCLLGPNGSGKTTLLRCLLGRLKPKAGNIVLDGRDLRKYSALRRARMIAYVPQIPQTAFAFTVRQIVLMGRFAHTGLLGLPGRKDHAVARQAMVMTATDALADRTLAELSGGEAQRVMIARALAQQPAAMLLDEPTSHLDIRNQLVIYRMMRRLAAEWGMAVMCVSHDVNLAGRFADEMVLMRDGAVVAAGPPAEVIRTDVLAEVYGVQVELINVPGRTVPLVQAK